jgi:hypothetical protein
MLDTDRIVPMIFGVREESELYNQVVSAALLHD